MVTMVYSLRTWCAHRVLRHFDRRESDEISNWNPSGALLSWIPSRQRCRPNQHMKSTEHVVSIIVWPAKLFLSVKPSTPSIFVGKYRIQNEHFCQFITQYCRIYDLHCLSDFCLWSVIISSAIPLFQLMFLGRKFTRKNNVHILIALSLLRTAVKSICCIGIFSASCRRHFCRIGSTNFGGWKVRQYPHTMGNQEWGSIAQEVAWNPPYRG